MSTTEYIQIIIGIGQIIAVAIIPIIVWVLGIKYQNRKAKKDAQLRVFLTLMADRKSTPITKEWVDALNTIGYEESYLHGFKSQAKRLFAEDGLGSLIPVIHAEGEFRTAEGKPFLIDI